MRLPSICFSLVLTHLGLTGAAAAELNLNIEIPRIDVAEYHRPYVAVWIERADQSVAANLAVWYQTSNAQEGTRWLPDLRQWWRRSGREQQFPIDGISGATRPVGKHRLSLDAAQAPLSTLAPGSYLVVVEAVREVGGREVVRVPLNWPIAASAQATAAGKAELGAVELTVKP